MTFSKLIKCDACHLFHPRDQFQTGFVTLQQRHWSIDDDVLAMEFHGETILNLCLGKFFMIFMSHQVKYENTNYIDVSDGCE